MRRQSIIALGAAIILGLIAVFLVNAYLSGADRRSQPADTSTVKVAVAQVELPFGAPVTPEKVRFVDWPKSSIPPGAFQTPAELTQGGQPRVVLRPLEIGEPIMRAKLSGEGGRATLSAILPADMRAASIPITDVAGVAGFVMPGDRVDIILAHQIGEVSVADVLLQDVRVIAIDQDSNDRRAAPGVVKTATLEVQPVEAQKLVLAQRLGTMSLALRSTTAQTGESYAGRVGPGNLLGRFGPPRPTPASAYVPDYRTPPVRRRVAIPATRAPTTSSVEVVRGTAGSKYDVGGYAGN